MIDGTKSMTCTADFWANISEEDEKRRARNRMAQRKYDERRAGNSESSKEPPLDPKDNSRSLHNVSTAGKSSSRKVPSENGARKKATSDPKSNSKSGSLPSASQHTRNKSDHCFNTSKLGNASAMSTQDINNATNSKMCDPAPKPEPVDNFAAPLGSGFIQNVVGQTSNSVPPFGEPVFASTSQMNAFPTHEYTMADIENTSQGFTALQKAAIYGHEAIVKLLISKGADIEFATHLGQRTIHLAAERGHLAIVRLLLQSNAQFEAVDIAGATALHLAAENGHAIVVKILLWKGAHIDAKDAAGGTALHRAVRNGHDEVVTLLLNMGADINARTYAPNE